MSPALTATGADSAHAGKAFKTAQARAALAGHTLVQVKAGYMLGRWTYSKHCPDLATVEFLLDRMGAPR